MNHHTAKGAPTYHSTSAHSLAATRSVPRRRQAVNEYDVQMQALKCGIAIGFIASALVFGLILWAWVIPTMDNAVSIARGMVA